MASQSVAQQQLTGQLVLMQAELSQLRVTVRDKDNALKAKDAEIDRLVRTSVSAVPMEPAPMLVSAVPMHSDSADKFAKSQEIEMGIRMLNEARAVHHTYPAMHVTTLHPHQVGHQEVPRGGQDPIPPTPSTTVGVTSKRTQPTLVTTTGDLRPHFPVAVHSYFTVDGEYDPEWQLFITTYLDQFIYRKCFNGSRITTMPDISDTLITQFKQWQRERLVLCSSNMRISFPYVLPDIIMELYCIYMDSMFIVQQSTIEGAGLGLFLRSGKILSEDMYFPYSGVLMPHTEQGDEDDKDILIRNNILIRGSRE